MASLLKVDKLDPQSGTALEIGTSGDTVTVPTGAGLTVTDEVKTNKISPATGTAFALGDSGDTFTIPSGATITNSGTATGFGGGKVLQVVSGTPQGNTSTTTTVFADTGLTVDITPAATANKILVWVSLVGIFKSGANNSLAAKLVRDTTDILEFGGIAAYNDSTDAVGVGGVSCNYLDSPSSTSATTYKVQFATTTGTGAVHIANWQTGAIRPLCTITVMEIEG